MLMTPTSTPHNNIMKSFIKRNTPLRVDPKVRSWGVWAKAGCGPAHQSEAA